MVSERFVLKFSKQQVDKPIVCRLVKEYGLDFNILKANITENEEGLLVLELSGKESGLKNALGYLKGIGVDVQPLKKEIFRNDSRCTQCGACVTVCPNGAFVVDAGTRKVGFCADRCIACELCIKACPVRAIEAHFR